VILIIDLMLEDPFAVARKLYQEGLKRCPASEELNVKLPPKVIDISGRKT
jgi:hypothetical protein